MTGRVAGAVNDSGGDDIWRGELCEVLWARHVSDERCEFDGEQDFPIGDRPPPVVSVGAAPQIVAADGVVERGYRFFGVCGLQRGVDGALHPGLAGGLRRVDSYESRFVKNR